MSHIQKEYSKYFVLPESKLQRIVDLAHERLRDTQAEPKDLFTVHFSGTRRHELGSLTDVLALDNSKRMRIRALEFCSRASNPDGLAGEVKVAFARPSSDPAKTRTKVVAIDVDGSDNAWANRAFSEIEEQVERTFQPTLPILLSILAIVAALLVVLAQHLGPPASFYLSDRLWLQGADFDRVREMVKDGHVLTEGEAREVETMQLRNMAAVLKPVRSEQEANLKLITFVLLPVFVLFVCAVLLLTYGYPSAVYLWGDAQEDFATRLHWRRVIWAVVIAVFVTGVANKFLGGALETYFGDFLFKKG